MLRKGHYGFASVPESPLYSHEFLFPNSTCSSASANMEEEQQPIASIDPEVVMEILKLVWLRTSTERDQKQEDDTLEPEVGPQLTKKKRVTTANANSLKLSCELLKLFVTEAVQRAALIAEAEGMTVIEATHLERILPQLLLDF